LAICSLRPPILANYYLPLNGALGCNTMKLALPILCLFISSSVIATQDQLASIFEFTQKASYEIKPVYFEEQECAKDDSCNEPIYIGEISFETKSFKESNLLSQIDIKLNGKKIFVEIIDKLINKKIYLDEFYISHSPAYLPLEMRDKIISFAPPYLSITGIVYGDESCKTKFRELELTYRFETKKAEISDGCTSE
jgi:hypothetical protein